MAPTKKSQPKLKRVAKAPGKQPRKGASRSVAPAGPPEIADWTILIYMAGDNDLDSFGGKDLKEIKKVGSTPRVHVVVQRDSAAEGAHRYYLRRGTSLKKDELSALGRINTGDPKVLQEFLTWGLATYPAKRTMAVLWNHGNGWDDTDIYAAAERRGLKPVAGGPGPRRGLGGGFSVHRVARPRRFRGPFFVTAFQTREVRGERRAIAFDDDAQDFLDSVELKNVFNGVAKKQKRKFSVIGMDACLMSMIENGIQVRSAGELFCGSQEVEPGDGWPYDRILAKLTANPTMDGRELTTLIVSEFVASYSKQTPVTQSALDLAALDQAQKAANSLGELLVKALKNPDDLAVEGAIERARKQSQRYEHPDYVDLFDFAAKLAALWPKCSAAATKVQQAVSKCVFANQAPHANVRGSHGLSIYLPANNVNPLYKKLDFAAGGWGKFLASLKP